ncbi:MAG: HypC/HybG/HupF family hydrogenase formation chaperone [Kiritimatiellae bacterium]|nr:HypC/HybG/HupF family hydrogenase formation chaperone [Kiritimatiellia bacterium]MBQ9343620.1 HypC/HybG/HupF family hydrogenase formation chaperone [Kiritimatiellia bacterium]MBR0057537.1 HypC/HybG/HupF family hydrogenase formation chaperone [Kiritimatiellia bacterium]
MCLAIPGRVVEVRGEGLERAGVVDFEGVRQDVSFAYLPDLQLGDYVLVHVGIALTKLDPADAETTLAEIRALAP